MKLPPLKPWEAWNSGLQWGILLVVLTAAAPGTGWAFHVWVAVGAVSVAAAIPWHVRAFRALRNKQEERP